MQELIPVSDAGLKWFSSRDEKALFGSLDLACIPVIGPEEGRPLAMSWGWDPAHRLKTLQEGSWKKLQIHHITWIASKHLGRRIQAEAHRLLTDRKLRLEGDWFELTPELARQTISVVSRKLNIPTMTHDQMISRVTTMAERKIEREVSEALAGL